MWLLCDLFTNFWFKEYYKIWLYLADFTLSFYIIITMLQEKEKEKEGPSQMYILTILNNTHVAMTECNNWNNCTHSYNYDCHYSYPAK